jgi:hypothetical protein
MKKSELQQLIREEIQNTLNEGPNMDMVNRSLDLLDKAANMAIKNPTGNVTELAKIIQKYVNDIRNNL